jgi:hypothetical protein
MWLKESLSFCGRFRDVAKEAKESGHDITSDNRAYYRGGGKSQKTSARIFGVLT